MWRRCERGSAREEEKEVAVVTIRQWTDQDLTIRIKKDGIDLTGARMVRVVIAQNGAAVIDKSDATAAGNTITCRLTQQETGGLLTSVPGTLYVNWDAGEGRKGKGEVPVKVLPNYPREEI